MRPNLREMWGLHETRRETITRQNFKRQKRSSVEIPAADGGANVLRVHDNGKSLSIPLNNDALPGGARSYVDREGRRWKKIFPPALTNSFNNMRANDAWIMMSAFMAGADDIILPYLKENRLFRVDTRVIAKAAIAFNAQGENGVQPGRMVKAETGRDYVRSV